MGVWTKLVGVLRRLQWMRGLRAGFAVAAAMIVCRMLGKPMGWAALGGFEAILVDNGGPYRSRLQTLAAVMLGGALGCVVGALASTPLIVAFIVTSVFCFAVTFLRVVAQPIASTSVIMIVLYFAGFGGSAHTLHDAMGNALAYVLGGAWTAVLSLGLWQVDPFRPARRAVADCYDVLANFTAAVRWTEHGSAERRAQRARTHELQRTMRLTIETAHAALESTAARTTARTVRARNLTVLLETADILFAETIWWVELLEGAGDEGSRAALMDSLSWVSGAERAVSRGLGQRPADGGAAFAPEGSYSLEHVRRRAEAIRARDEAGSSASVLRYLAADEKDALQNIEIAFEAVRAVWSGSEVRAGGAVERWKGLAQGSPVAGAGASGMDALRANWAFESLMMRHALRMAVVGGVDVLLMYRLHLSHGVWLAMTSLIVLQPYGSGTLRRTAQRVGGTIGGGFLAALLAALIHTETGVIVVITVTSVLSLATYALDYGWFSFFLTPTFVLMSLPHLNDWHFAGLRILTTVVGATVALAAMWLLWPEREETELGQLLGRGAAADAAYVRTMVKFWTVGAGNRAAADRELMAPARRRCGLSINDAEEALDRLMQEPSFGLRSLSGKDLKTSALTFVTYLRRLTRAVTTLGGLEVGDASAVKRVEAVAERLEAVSAVLLGSGTLVVAEDKFAPAESKGGIAEELVRRMERQAGVMERAAGEILQETA